MLSYNDNDMFMRKQFVHNIPYLRGLSDHIILKVIELVNVDLFEQG